MNLPDPAYLHFWLSIAAIYGLCEVIKIMLLAAILVQVWRGEAWAKSKR